MEKERALISKIFKDAVPFLSLLNIQPQKAALNTPLLVLKQYIEILKTLPAKDFLSQMSLT